MIDFNDITHQLTPDVLIETDWTSGLSGLPSTAKRTLLVGYRLEGGTMADGIVKPIVSGSQARQWWGDGSQLAVMAEAFLDGAPRSPLYGVSYAEGTNAKAAFGTITVKGAATGSGTLKVWIGGRLFQLGVAKGDTAESVGKALEALIKPQANLPVAISQAAGVVTLTAKNKGTEGNTIRFRSEMTAAGLTAADSGAALAGGATDGDPTQVLSGIEGARTHLIVLNGSDAARLGKLAAHIDKQSSPQEKKWGMGIGALTGTLSHATTLAAALDSPRCQVVWHRSCEQPSFELAARFAALRSTKAPNISLDDTALKGITAPSDETAWLTSREIEAALSNGITPLRSRRSGHAEVVRSVVTRHSEPVAFIDHMVPEISDYTDEFIINVFTQRVKGRPMKSGSPAGTPKTVTPKKATALLNECLLILDRMDYLQGVQSSIKAGRNVAEVNALEPASRLDVAFDFWPVGFAHVIAMKKTFRTAL